MLGAVERVIGFLSNGEHRINLITNALKSDFSWKRGAKEYAKLYKKLEV